MLYLSVPELIAEAAKLVPAIKDAGVTATSERLTQLQDQTIVVKYGGNAMTDETLQQQFAQDVALLTAMGVPVVRPSYTPERISTASGSLRCVTWRLVPGRRRSRSCWMSASLKAMPGGQPSITQPMAGPWDSPKLVTQKRVPRVLPLIEVELSRTHKKIAASACLASPGSRFGVKNIRTAPGSAPPAASRGCRP